MISNDETSCQYDISMVAECLNEVFDQGLEEVEVETDLKLINQFMDEGVHYIEF